MLVFKRTVDRSPTTSGFWTYCRCNRQRHEKRKVWQVKRSESGRLVLSCGDVRHVVNDTGRVSLCPCCEVTTIPHGQYVKLVFDADRQCRIRRLDHRKRRKENQT